MTPNISSYVREIASGTGAYQHRRFQLSERDYQIAASMHPSTKQRARRVWAFSLLIIVGGVWFVTIAGPLALVIVVIGMSYPFFFYLLVRTLVRRSYQSMEAILVQPVELIYGPGFVAYETRETFSVTTWLFQVVRGKSLYLLALSNQSYFAVPTRAFEDAETLTEFNSVVTAIADQRVITSEPHLISRIFLR
jgi:hypothetical protein